LIIIYKYSQFFIRL